MQEETVTVVHLGQPRGAMQVRYVVVAIAVLVTLFGGYLYLSHPTTTSSSDTDKDTDQTTTVSETPITVPAGAVVIDIAQGGCECLVFDSSNITVVLGVNATVAWTNHDSNGHEVVCNGLFDGSLPPGGAFVFTFTQPGTYQWYDPNYVAFSGVIIVRGS